MAILEHARNLIQRLEDPKLVWPRALQSGVKLDPEVWVGELSGPMKRLTEARKDVAREEREAQATGVASLQKGCLVCGRLFRSVQKRGCTKKSPSTP